MSEPGSKDGRFKTPVKAALDQPTAASEVVSDPVRTVARQLKHLELETRVLRNGWVVYAVDLLGPDVAVRPAKDDDGEHMNDPWLTACAVWEISEGGYRWVRPVVAELDRRYEQIDLDYLPERGTLWASRRLQIAEMSTEQILGAMWQLTDACAVAWGRIAALGLGRRFHSAWLGEDLMPSGNTLAQLRREPPASGGPSTAPRSKPSSKGESR